MPKLRLLFFVLFLLTTGHIDAQIPAGYLDSLKQFRNNYTQHHEIVKPVDAKYFHFYPIDPAYRVVARFTPIPNAPWFDMKTSTGSTQRFRKYGRLDFRLNGKDYALFVYQSMELLNSADYANYLFIPFTDETSAVDTYGGGRYIDCTMPEIKNGRLVIDFNKAYNPYCAYAAGYECPVPPRENNLPVAIHAGEKNFGKPAH